MLLLLVVVMVMVALVMVSGLGRVAGAAATAIGVFGFVCVLLRHVLVDAQESRLRCRWRYVIAVLL